MRFKRQLWIAYGSILCALLLSTTTYATTFENINGSQQQKEANFGKTIKGKIMDENNEPIIGASVRLKDQNVGTITDIDGNYSLIYRGEVPIDVLVSYIGYIGKSVRYTGQSPLIIVLTEDVKQLGEVVVTGYQTISKERATGAFAILNNQAIEKKINTDVAQALEGQIAGVTTYGGNVVIRGRSTVSNAVGTNPLLVIDGLPTERSMDDINVNDVESMTVLKDAASTSIYGSRAANGVIVITTKKAETGKIRFNFNADWKWEENPSLSDYHYASSATNVQYEQMFWARTAGNSNLTVDQWVKNRNTAYGTGTSSYASPLMTMRMQLADGEITQAQYDEGVQRFSSSDYRQSYMDALWRTPFRQNYNLSISSASDRQNTFVSATLTEDILQAKTDKNRSFKANFKTTQKIAKWLSIDLGLDTQYGRTQTTDDFFSFDAQMNSFASYIPVYENGDKYYLPYAPNFDAATSWFGGTTIQYSPKRIQGMKDAGIYESMAYNILDEAYKHTELTHSTRLRSYIKANFELYKGLKFSTSFDYETSQTDYEKEYAADSYLLRQLRNRMISGSSTVPVSNFPAGGYLEQSSTEKKSYTFRNQLDYNTMLKEKHSITALVGLELREVENPLNTASKRFGYDPQMLSSSSSTSLNATLLSVTGVNSLIYNSNQKVSSTLLDLPAKLTYSMNRYLSFYGAGGYTYKNLYNVSASARIDQTNLFGIDPQYRYRPLWSIGLGWNISNENFMKTITWVDMLTLRGSYGVTGNVDQSSTPYITVSSQNTTSTLHDTYKYTSLGSAPNPTLRWEKTTSYALGADFSVFKGMLTGKIEGYYKYSDDLLTTSTLPLSTGYSSSTINNGAISNQGIEITLSSPWFKSKDWKFSSTFIYAYNKNKVEKVYNTPKSATDLIKQPWNYYQEGMPYNALYAYHFAGITTDGDDAQNGLPIISLRDGTPIYTVAKDPTTGKYVVTTMSSTAIKPEEAVYMGTLDPKWSGSFTQNIQYKNFELSAMFTYYGGHKVRKPTYNYFVSNPEAYATMSNLAEQGWSSENPNTSLPRAGVYYPLTVNSSGLSINEFWRYSDIHVVDGDMIRLRNISLSYTLPQRYALAARLTKVKLTGQINNLWYWSAAGDDIDPETYSTYQSGSTTYKTPNAINRTLPSMTSYLMRLEITF